MTPVEFLCAIQPDGPWALGAITPDGGPKAWRTVDEPEEIEKFVERYGSERNLYYQVNLVRPDLGSKRADKSDVRECIAVWVEIDPPDDVEDLAKWQRGERDKIQPWGHKGLPPPRVAIFSGSGFQFIWLLDEPTDDFDAIEAVNRALAKRLGGDSSTDVSRLLRLPGTLNHPGEKKRRKYGRTRPVLADVIHCKPQRTYSLDLFDTEEARDGGDARIVEPGPRVTEKELKGLVPRRMLRLRIKNGPLRGEDRSDAMWGAAADMLELGVPEDRIVAILLDPTYKIGAHARDQKDPLRAASRAVTRQDHEDEPGRGIRGAVGASARGRRAGVGR